MKFMRLAKACFIISYEMLPSNAVGFFKNEQK